MHSCRFVYELRAGEAHGYAAACLPMRCGCLRCGYAAACLRTPAGKAVRHGVIVTPAAGALRGPKIKRPSRRKSASSQQQSARNDILAYQLTIIRFGWIGCALCSGLPPSRCGASQAGPAATAAPGGAASAHTAEVSAWQAVGQRRATAPQTTTVVSGRRQRACS
eukprot:356979-Chlamydomonas_euryale.AAC.2